MKVSIEARRKKEEGRRKKEEGKRRRDGKFPIPCLPDSLFAQCPMPNAQCPIPKSKI
ncbi:hypothetical protein QUA81_28025 [Microcoleus sp. F6_B4]